MAKMECGETVPPKEKLLAMYRTMLTIRMFEESISEAFARGLIPGFIHLCIGQEATAAGTGANLRADDYIISTHRGHGHCIAKGADVRLMAAEIFGRATGYCKGRGGSMHVAAPALGILGANGIVGGGLPIINGAALSAQMRGTDQVAVCFFGEGASNEGTFHEAVNLAAVWKLPVVFLCENNGYAEFTPLSTHMAVKSVAGRASAYGIDGLTVDGNDVLQVYEGVRGAVERARRGTGLPLWKVSPTAGMAITKGTRKGTGARRKWRNGEGGTRSPASQNGWQCRGSWMPHPRNRSVWRSKRKSTPP